MATDGLEESQNISFTLEDAMTSAMIQKNEVKQSITGHIPGTENIEASFLAGEACNDPCQPSSRKEESKVHLTNRTDESNLSFTNINEDIAAVIIQTLFRGFLARQALKSLKGLVRLQALIRGYLVRRQAGTTLRCVKALVRVQAHVRARRVRMSKEGQAVQEKLELRRQQDVHPRKLVEGWNSSSGTLQESQAKIESRKEGAAKRERALAYAFSRQVWRSAQKQSCLIIDGRPDKSHWGWSWLERWMAARPWETACLDSNDEDLGGALVPSQEDTAKVPKDDSGGQKPARFRSKSISDSFVNPLSSSSSSSLTPKPVTNPFPPTPNTPGTDESINHTVLSQVSSTITCSPTKPGVPAGTHTSSDVVEMQEATSDIVTELANTSVLKRDCVSTDKQNLMKDEQSSGLASRPAFTRRSFSGPLTGINGESSNIGSSMPGYMAKTESYKAKIRSHSNPKPRPEAQEKTSPKRRISLPLELKQASTLTRAFRSSSTKSPAFGRFVSAARKPDFA